jgi:hypothetical protein
MAKSTPRRASKPSKANRLERKHHMSGAFLGTIAMGVLSIIASFGLGIRSAGEIRTLEHSEAAQDTADILQHQKGDMNRNGMYDVNDAILMEERILGYARTTQQDVLDGDMNADFKLTGQDLLALLHKIEER